MNDILHFVKKAQESLRSTQINWQEDCLFDADEFLSKAIRLLEREQADGDYIPDIGDVDESGMR